MKTKKLYLSGFRTILKPSRAVFSIEAIVSLMVLILLIARPVHHATLDKAVIYKQGSDISELVLDLNLDPIATRQVLELTNPDLQMKIVKNNKEIVIKWDSPKDIIVLKRSDFSGQAIEDVYFYFGY